MKINSLNETLQEKDDQLKEKDDEIKNVKHNVEILTSSKNFIKKSYDALQVKVKKIESENFLIPKVKKEEQKKDEEADGSDGSDLTTILQNELRDALFKLRQKEQIIQEFKKEAKAYAS